MFGRPFEVLAAVIEVYLRHGAPVGSETLCSYMKKRYSSATLRNEMAVLEREGYLKTLHTSSGRVPTARGLEWYIQGVLTTGIDESCGKALQEMRKRWGGTAESASEVLSELCQCAGVVGEAVGISPIRRIEFVCLAPRRCCVILVTDDGHVDQRLVTFSHDIEEGSLEEASRYLNQHIAGLSLCHARKKIEQEMAYCRDFVNAFSKEIIQQGLAVWGNDPLTLTVKGHGRLLHALRTDENLRMFQDLLMWLETQAEFLKLMESVLVEGGVRVFVGSDESPFHVSGFSLILVPYGQCHENFHAGVVGVVGPYYMDYRHAIPTVKVMANLIGKGE